METMVDAANRAMIGMRVERGSTTSPGFFPAIMGSVSEAGLFVTVSFHPTLIVELCLLLLVGKPKTVRREF